jgi:hypothetical protein
VKRPAVRWFVDILLQVNLCLAVATRKTLLFINNIEKGEEVAGWFWTHPYFERNIKCRFFVAANQLQESDSKFTALYRMSKASYQHLLQMTVPALTKHNTNMRECVSTEERLLITLR